MLNDELLKILCCPVCKGELEYFFEQNYLKCTKCCEKYSVMDDIPVMLPGEFEKNNNPQK